MLSNEPPEDVTAILAAATAEPGLIEGNTPFSLFKNTDFPHSVDSIIGSTYDFLDQLTTESSPDPSGAETKKNSAKFITFCSN